MSASRPSLAPTETRHPSWEACRELLDDVVDYALATLDVEGCITSWNLGAERIHGYRASTVLGKPFALLYPAADVATDAPQLDLETAAAQGRVEREGFRTREDGAQFWAQIVLTAVRDASGELRGFGYLARDLSTARAEQEKLRRSEQRFHHLVDAVVDYAIFMLDPEGYINTWNSGAVRVKGYVADEIIGKHFSVFHTEEDRKRGKPEANLAFARLHGRHEDESWRVRKDGSRFWANVIITALYDETGQLTGFAKVTRDLSARREAEETAKRLLREQTAREVAEQGEHQLRQSEERYRSISQRLEIVLQGVADGITVQDRSHNIVFANQAAARICGFESVEELMNTPGAEVVARFDIRDESGNPIDPNELPARKVLDGEPSTATVLHVRERSTGREWWSMVRAGAVLGPEGEPELAVNIWHDVTAARTEERKAKCLADATVALSSSLEAEEMLATLAQVLVPGLADWSSVYLFEGGDLSHVAIAHADPSRVALAKRYCETFPPRKTDPAGVWRVANTGVSELYNDLTDEALVARARSEEQLAMLRSLEISAVLIAPIRIRTRIVGVIALAYGESKRRYEPLDVALAEELGQRAGTALENAQLYRAAQEAAKAAEEASRAKDEFLATVSHELRTPLSAILGWSTLLKDRVTDPTIAKPLEVIHRNARAQVKIIDDILDVARVITGKLRLEPRPTDLVSITREALEVIRPSAVAKNLDIQFTTAQDYCLLVADPERLQQVAWNLLSNAVKFTPQGGTIRVSLHHERSTFALTVSDTGRGIDSSFLPFVFERFRQADSSITRHVGGLGLGLAVVRHIVELHGGQVSAESQGPGLGATFTIKLPIRAVLPTDEIAPARSSLSPAIAAPPAFALSGVRILAIDDEPDARELVASVLNQAGAKVETARSAEEGFELFRSFRPDIVVSDIGMPDQDGFAFMRRIRALDHAEGGDVPSVALTAFAHEEDRKRALAAGYTAHLSKPVDPRVLTVSLLKLTQRGEPSRKNGV